MPQGARAPSVRKGRAQPPNVGELMAPRATAGANKALDLRVIEDVLGRGGPGAADEFCALGPARLNPAVPEATHGPAVIRQSAAKHLQRRG